MTDPMDLASDVVVELLGDKNFWREEAQRYQRAYYAAKAELDALKNRLRTMEIVHCGEPLEGTGEP